MNCSIAFWMLLPAKVNVEMNSGEHAVYPHELQSELTLMVGFGKFTVKCNKPAISVYQISYVKIK